LLLLVGGGVAQILFFPWLWLVGTRINKPLAWWRKILPGGPKATLGKLWPKHFIAAAEEAGLIMAIWEWVFVAALIQHNAWQQEGLPPVTIGVNLSSVQFADAGLAARVQEIAGVVGVPLEYIELELTELALVADFVRALETLQRCAACEGDRRLRHRLLVAVVPAQAAIDKLKLDQSHRRCRGKGAAIARDHRDGAASTHLVAEASRPSSRSRCFDMAARPCRVTS
jgi:hypothetical protein